MMRFGSCRRRHSTARPRRSAIRNTSTSTSPSPSASCRLTPRHWATGRKANRRPALPQGRIFSTGPTMATMSFPSGRRRRCCRTSRQRQRYAGGCLPRLVQDILEIVNSVTSLQRQLEVESLAVQDMVELVVTMQEEADSLMEYSDLVEEYVDMVNDEVTSAVIPFPAYSIDTVDMESQEESDGDGEGEGAGRDPGDLSCELASWITVGIPSSTLGKAKHMISREPQFRDSALGLSESRRSSSRQCSLVM
ncbi:hypothetical protein DHEL01_v205631 [Diaporthe helianthi]|uniref:Uncharacterized protein n=1 Tax=Diaporthe helianthi TaxID=158607 RepID=A0A2P5I0B4_DIAHE|nr:hypothetical protein DHEL01_v205631 [Diaporthe helianthi]